MDITMITVETWEALMTKFPEAYQFLLENALREEKRMLEAELENIRHGWLHDARWRTWVEARLEQLNMVSLIECLPRQ